MKKTVALFVFLSISLASFAQLKGSGKTNTNTYDFKNFDKLYLDDLDGTILVTIGDSWSVAITIDENLEELLTFEEKNNGSLRIYFKGNKNNRMYVEDTNLKINITMPKLIDIRHDGNSRLTVLNCKSDALKIENRGNSTTKIKGSVTNISVSNSGNGGLFAEELMVKTATINCSGNGNVKVNVSDLLTGKTTGNGNIINKGSAKFRSDSSKKGNGNLIHF